METLSLQSRIDAVLQAAGLDGPVTALSTVAPIVSPMARAADWICAVVQTPDRNCFIKLLAPDAASFVSVADAASGAGCAAAQGVGAALVAALPEHGALVLEHLAPPWREARLGDLANPAVQQAVADAKRRMQRGPTLPRHWDVFAQIDALAALPGLPPETDGVHRRLADIRAALPPAGRPLAPCHCDGAASNVMLHPDGRVALVDFDCAGMADPLYDAAVVLNEICGTPQEWPAAAAVFGIMPEDMAQCRAYAAADDYFWALWGFTRHAASRRPMLEFLKYGAWRLLRCRMALGGPGLLGP